MQVQPIVVAPPARGHRVALQHQHLRAGLLEHRGRGEPAGASPDHHRLMALDRFRHNGIVRSRRGPIAIPAAGTYEPSGRLMAVAKQKQIKMQMQVGALGAIQQLEGRTDDQLKGESKHKVAAKALLGARAAERYDAKAARAYFNEALAGCHPQERPALRQMMKASMALAERRPDDLKEAVEKLGQAPPSSRQLFLLRMMGLVVPASRRELRAAGPRHLDPGADRARARCGRIRPRKARGAAVRRRRPRSAACCSA